MDPIAFHIGSWPIYWYGIFVALGFLGCITHWNIISQREGYPRGFGSELGFWVMLSAIVGARTAFIIANIDDYLAHPLEIFRLDQGGLIYYGGFIGSTTAVTVLAIMMKRSIWAMGDFGISAIPLGHAIGRIGCFINGCCFGTPTDVPWCTLSHGEWRHPTPLYETLFNLTLYVALIFLHKRKKRDGEVFATYLVGYAIGRFLIEFFRGDQRVHFLGLTVAQNISMALFLAGCLLWVGLPKKLDRPEPHASA